MQDCVTVALQIDPARWSFSHHQDSPGIMTAFPGYASCRMAESWNRRMSEGNRLEISKIILNGH